MKHLGDITKISGYDAPVVDVIIGGSPCQDLSIAGKRAGLAGERSGLYMEQIRIIKEMREADVLRGRTDVDVRHRYMVWENVPGAFSSNGGQDFAAVLEEAIRVAEPEAPHVPVPKKGWPTSGCFWDELGRWSVAWRVLDAQFWGTSDKPLPQRRRRIALVADFGGLSAPEILFVRKSVSGNLEPGEPKGKETARDAGEGTGGAVPCTLKIRGECSGGGKGALIQEDKSATLSTLQDQTLFQPVTYCLQGSGATSQNSQGIGYKEDKSYTLNTLDVHGVAYNKYLFENHSQDSRYKGPLEVSPMLSAQLGTGGNNTPLVIEPVAYGIGNGQVNQSISEEQVGALDCMHDQKAVVYQITVGSLCARDYKGVGSQHVDEGKCIVERQNHIRHIVRRLTPMECERLQGFLDGWTDIGEWVDSKGKIHKEADSPRYKALGNSIAIPPWKWVLKRLCACYERDATMASLFDGIGGFPYIWEQLNGKGSCLWASEIEEFPMAVTKARFP